MISVKIVKVTEIHPDGVKLGHSRKIRPGRVEAEVEREVESQVGLQIIFTGRDFLHRGEVTRAFGWKEFNRIDDAKHLDFTYFV